MEQRLKEIKRLADQPMQDDRVIGRVEIIMLKFNEAPEVIDRAISRIVHNTKHPFKLTIFDNRPNTANTSRIWNKLLAEATCDRVLFIDSDAFVPEGIEPCWLTRLVESIEEAAVVVPFGDNVGGTNKATSAAPYPTSGPQQGIWSGFCFLVNRPVIYKEFGPKPFDEDFFIYGQDSEFAFRTAKRKLCVYRPDVLIQHLGGYSFKKADSDGAVDREADKIYAAALYRLKTSGRLL